MNEFSRLRVRLLELHKALLDAERAEFARRSGRISPTEFLHALTHDTELAWLAPLSAAIVRFDELSEARASQLEAAALADHLEHVRALLELEAGADTFGARYSELVQSSPEVAFAHAVLLHEFGAENQRDTARATEPADHR